MLIKIIKGNYGYNNGVSLKVKTPADPPFNVPVEEALRLANLGVAKILKEDYSALENDPDTPPFDGGDGEKTEKTTGNADGNDSEDYSDEDSADGTPAYSKESTNAELQAIANKWGIELPNRANKAQILEILDSHFGNAPKLSAREPE